RPHQPLPDVPEEPIMPIHVLEIEMPIGRARRRFSDQEQVDPRRAVLAPSRATLLKNSLVLLHGRHCPLRWLLLVGHSWPSRRGHPPPQLPAVPGSASTASI